MHESILEKLRLVFGKYGIPAYFKLTKTLWQPSVKPEEPISRENVVGPVYKSK